MPVTPAAAASEVVDGCVWWLRGDPVLDGVPTIAAWVPAVEPARPRMPAVYVHATSMPDVRASFNGAGGVRQRTLRLSVDVWWSITGPDPTGDQAAALDLTEQVIDRLIADPTWDGLVSHSTGIVDCQLADDTYGDLLAGRGILTWRISLDAHRYPIATT